MRIAIGSDRAGLDLKRSVTRSLLQEHHEVIDVGMDRGDTADHAEYAEAVAEALREYKAERGIILCGSGVGASMAANRIPGIRAGLCHDTYSAHQGVEHDDMNVLVLGGRVVGAELARELIHAFLNARFKGEARRARVRAKLTPFDSAVRALQVFGQAVWIDYMRRSLIGSGELRRMIDEDGIRGVSFSPSILEKAIAGGWEYTDLLDAPDARTLDAKALYEQLAIRDVRSAADALRGVYTETSRRDGYVTFDVPPALAYDTAATVAEARRLAAAVDRHNLMMTVPATAQGIAAMRTLIGTGISVNATLVFAEDAYEQVVDAYIDGLEEFVSRGGDPSRVASVASVFVSRIDTAIDERIAATLETSRSADVRRVLRALHGKVAIANAKLIFQRCRELFSGPRWNALAARGTQTQRLLWASTSTKNPAYRDVMYVEELIGPDTVDAIPSPTLDAFRDHGRPRGSLTEDVDGAEDTLRLLAEAGISLKDVADTLLADGLRLQTDAFERLLKTIDGSRHPEASQRAPRFTFALPAGVATAVKRSLTEWSAEGRIRRFWARDASLWTGRDESQWLGWLGVTNGQRAHMQRLTRMQDLAAGRQFSAIVLLGTGSSTMCADVLARTFGRRAGFPELHMLDSTDPAALRALERRLDLRNALFVVTSTSSASTEAHVLGRYFFDRIATLLGRPEAGRRFIAITDPGSPMQQEAERDGFRHVFLGWPTIAHGYYMLSDFGLVPAALMGVDVATLLERAEGMVYACMPPVPVAENPGAVLGAILAAAARQGRDKLTFAASPSLAGLAAWAAQLVAESTGKDGKGLIPIDGETVGPAASYGKDRLFAYLSLASESDVKQAEAIDAIEQAGHPVVRIVVDEPSDVGAEFFRWQMAASVAASLLEINPFDQPDVEASKRGIRKLIAEYEKSGVLPTETPLFDDGGITVFADSRSAPVVSRVASGTPTLASCLKAHLNRLKAGDYAALLAFVPRIADHERILQDLRHRIRHATHAATCLEFGPRFLHGAGQAYKGGPNSGLFLQLTCDDTEDAPVPGRRSTFGIIKAAQARGDFQALADRDRSVLRLHLGLDVAGGLRAVHGALQTALA